MFRVATIDDAMCTSCEQGPKNGVLLQIPTPSGSILVVICYDCQEKIISTRHRTETYIYEISPVTDHIVRWAETWKAIDWMRMNNAF